MPRLQIELDAATSEALSSLAGARGTTPADLAAEIVGKYVHVPAQQPQPDPLDALVGSIDADPDDGYRAPPDPLDAIVGSVDAEPTGRKLAPPDSIDALVGRYVGVRVNDIDEVVYGR